MSESIKFPNMDDVVKGIAKTGGLIESASLFGIRQVAINLVRETQGLLNNNAHTQSGKSWIPSGHIGANGSPPNRRTGSLSASIQMEQVVGLPGYAYKVFPTMEYARALELGNPRWKSGVRYPYLGPSANKVRLKASKIFTQAFLSKYKV